MVFNRTSCCGLTEIEDIGKHMRDDGSFDFEEFMLAFKADRGIRDFETNVYYFTDAKFPRTRRDTAGDKLARYIVKNKLGTITRSPYQLNHKSGNIIRVYVWNLSKKAGAISQ